MIVTSLKSFYTSFSHSNELAHLIELNERIILVPISPKLRGSSRGCRSSLTGRFLHWLRGFGGRAPQLPEARAAGDPDDFWVLKLPRKWHLWSYCQKALNSNSIVWSNVCFSTIFSVSTLKNLLSMTIRISDVNGGNGDYWLPSICQEECWEFVIRTSKKDSVYEICMQSVIPGIKQELNRN